MEREVAERSSPSRLLTGALFYIVAAVVGLGKGACLARGVEVTGIFGLALSFTFPWLLGFWIERDGEKGEVMRVWDLGFFVYLSWVVIGPYYFLKTRGAKGLLPILGIVSAYFLAVTVSFLFFRR